MFLFANQYCFVHQPHHLLIFYRSNNLQILSEPTRRLLLTKGLIDIIIPKKVKMRFLLFFNHQQSLSKLPVLQTPCVQGKTVVTNLALVEHLDGKSEKFGELIFTKNLDPERQKMPQRISSFLHSI